MRVVVDVADMHIVFLCRVESEFMLHCLCWRVSRWMNTPGGSRLSFLSVWRLMKIYGCGDMELILMGMEHTT